MEKSEIKNKRVYEPPKVVFVPLKIEERLLACGKVGQGGSNQCEAAGFLTGLSS